jgi:4-hydroxy-tetrahydrodipicolinate synthase
MTLRGEDEYALNFNETDALSSVQAQFAKAQLQQFDAWYTGWTREANAHAGH